MQELHLKPAKICEQFWNVLKHPKKKKNLCKVWSYLPLYDHQQKSEAIIFLIQMLPHRLKQNKTSHELYNRKQQK